VQVVEDREDRFFRGRRREFVDDLVEAGDPTGPSIEGVCQGKV
jgi:hypothetical protein